MGKEANDDDSKIDFYPSGVVGAKWWFGKIVFYGLKKFKIIQRLKV